MLELILMVDSSGLMMATTKPTSIIKLDNIFLPTDFYYVLKT